MSAFTLKPLAIETIDDAECFKTINRTTKTRLRPWVKFAIRNTLIAVAVIAVGGFGYYARFCM